MARKRYPADLTTAQWQRIERRELVNAMLYIVREGCSWRALPHDYPAWQTVYHYFRVWRDDGTWQRIHDALRDEVRTAADRNPSPSAAILDAQSVKTAEKGGPVAGMMPASASK